MLVLSKVPFDFLIKALYFLMFDIFLVVTNRIHQPKTSRPNLRVPFGLQALGCLKIDFELSFVSALNITLGVEWGETEKHLCDF